ncbi:ABC transporter transmembrane domain-containing protein, partial [Bacillus paralicheniformis]|uniref:ABC transporter transmembrane domain-containing protein n=1 Tax=Bacillus paralicheniformis TaxID=1648923 RepID=UPI0020C14632
AMFDKIQSFTLATYQKFSIASLITRLTNDVTQVQTVLFMSLRIMPRAPLAVIGSIVMAFVVNSKLALFLVIGAP